MTPTKKPPEPALPAHAFEEDPDIPVDPYLWVAFCQCGKAGKQGDDQHPDGAPPLSLIGLPPVPEGDVSDRIVGEGSG